MENRFFRIIMNIFKKIKSLFKQDLTHLKTKKHKYDYSFVKSSTPTINTHLQKSNTGTHNTYLQNDIILLEDLKLDQIPRVYHLLNNSDNKVSYKAVVEITSLLKEIEPKSLIKLDKQFRSTTSYTWSNRWQNIELDDYLTDNCDTEQRLLLICLSSFHPSGYFREKALKELHYSNYTSSLPYLFIRLNDWVTQVSTLAEESFYKQVEKSNKEDLLSLLPFLEYYRKNSPEKYKKFIDRTNEIILNKININDYEQSYDKAGYALRNSIISFMIRNKLYIKSFFKTLYYKEKNPLIRYQLIRFCLNDKLFLSVSELNSVIIKDKYYKIKIEILKYFEEHGKDDLERIYLDLLYDKNRSIRIKAQEYLKYLNVRQLYIDKIKSNRNTRVAILSLSEFKNKEDVELIKPFLNDERPEIIRSVLLALNNINEELDFNEYIEFLFSDNQGISSTTMKIFKDKINFNDSILIDNKMNNTDMDYIKINCLKLLYSLSKWDSIFYMIKYFSSNDIKINEFCSTGIKRWKECFNNSFIPIKEIQKNRNLEILELNKDFFSENEYKSLAFSLK